MNEDKMEKMENSKIGSFALAWITTKLTEPFRFAFTLYILPKLAKVLRSR